MICIISKDRTLLYSKAIYQSFARKEENISMKNLILITLVTFFMSSLNAFAFLKDKSCDFLIHNYQFQAKISSKILYDFSDLSSKRRDLIKDMRLNKEQAREKLSELLKLHRSLFKSHIELNRIDNSISNIYKSYKPKCTNKSDLYRHMRETINTTDDMVSARKEILQVSIEFISTLKNQMIQYHFLTDKEAHTLLTQFMNE